MFGFRPTNTSSPAKPLVGSSLLAQTMVSDVSRVSASSKSELQALSPGEVEFLDAVIRRITADSTSFLSGLKAYNDELHQRGLDSQTETVHYGRLLELCKLRGPSWQAKWDAVKKQYGYGSSLISAASRSRTPTQPLLRKSTVPKFIRPAAYPTTPIRDDDDDVFTLHSHQDPDRSQTPEEEQETEGTHISDTETENDPALNGIAGRNQPHSVTARLSNTTATRVANPILPPSLTYQRTPRLQTTTMNADRRIQPWEITSDTTDDAIPSPSATPPSYRAAIRGTTVTKSIATQIRNQILPRAPSPIKLPSLETSLQEVLPQSRQRRGSVINEEDAWKKIKMARDEEDAAKFHKEKLLERCWEVWLLGYQWMVTTNQQVAEARDNVIVGSALRRWRTASASLLERRQSAVRHADSSCLRRAMTVWKAKLKLKRQVMWRNDMREKMKLTRQKRETKVQKDAWAKWRQSYRSHLSELQYNERVVMKFFLQWKTRLVRLDRLEATADGFSRRPNGSTAVQTWKFWRRALSIRNAEKLVQGRVGLRVTSEVMEIWKKHTRNRQAADVFYDLYVMKAAIRSWKTVLDRIRSMERRADKRLARQDDVLVRAVTRVWKARERGRLLEKVRALRLVKEAWLSWRERMRQQSRREDCALAFSMRSNSYTVMSTFHTWQQVYAIYQNRRNFAVQRDLARIQYDALLTWRILLRARLKSLRHARIVEKFFVQRRILKLWKFKLQEKNRQNKLRALETCKLREYMRVWQQKANRRRWLRTAEQHINNRVSTRVMTDALSRWTNRVIEIKLRELEVAHKNAQTLMMVAFKKWKSICLRHVEDLSLMESHLDIKRAENMRRMFHKWLTAARARRHKRITLQKKELEFDRASVQVAWERWKEKYMDEKLRPLAHQVAIQTNKNLVFRAFGIWHAKTKSLPAIRFCAYRTKAKFWEKWRGAMPQALEAKRARETHKFVVLSRIFRKWNQAYKTKRQLKEIARARYLRLPSVSTGQCAATPKPSVPLATRSVFPRRNVRVDTETEESDAGPSRPAVRPAILGSRSGIASLLSTQARGEPPARSRPKLSSRATREASPTRSKSSVLNKDEPPSSPRPRFTAKCNASPTRSNTIHTRASSPPISAAPASPVRQSEPERSRLWQELSQVRMRSRPPTERSRSPDPP
ncbi:hypothetical protein F5I97DRAFT_530889 [Phlebopus sp. FC_14]|nr:hypothetical protein F5I97DRAFT_530889 [Phlebopus sp. FC_14]